MEKSLRKQETENREGNPADDAQNGVQLIDFQIERIIRHVSIDQKPFQYPRADMVDQHGHERRQLQQIRGNASRPRTLRPVASLLLIFHSMPPADIYPSAPSRWRGHLPPFPHRP